MKTVITKTSGLTILAAFGLMVQSAFGATNLIKNGGFEVPVVPVGYLDSFGVGTSFAGWQVMGAPGSVSVVSDSYTAEGLTFPSATGEQWLDLTGSGSNTLTGVQQAVTTTAGATYSLSFSIGNIYDPKGVFGTTSTLNVFVNGTQLFSITNLGGAGVTNQVWQKYTTTFVATSAKTTIAFVNGDGPADGSNGLDTVSLVAVAQ